MKTGFGEKDVVGVDRVVLIVVGRVVGPGVVEDVGSGGQ